MQQTSRQESTSLGAGAGQISDGLRLFLSGAAGTLAFLLIRWISPVPPRSSVLEPILHPDRGLPDWYYAFMEFINRPYVILPWVLLCLFLAILKRNEPKSWVYAFLVGYSFPFIVFHWVFHWI